MRSLVAVGELSPGFVQLKQELRFKPGHRVFCFTNVHDFTSFFA
jgi:hypothetical protein